MHSALDISPANRWLHRFAWFTAITTLLLVCSGGMVTSKGVGLAVPDWPTTFGYNMFLFPVSKWVGGILFEHTHRLLASTVGFLTIILAVWLARSNADRWVKTLGWFSLGAVVLQGILGGLRVTLLKDQIGVFHACLAQAFLGMLVLIALATSVRWNSLGRVRRSEQAESLLDETGWEACVTARTPCRLVPGAAMSLSLLIYAQLALGASMRHQHRDLAITDFPAAYGRVIPDTSAAALAAINARRDALALSDVTAGQIWLQYAHRGLATIIAIGVVGFWFLVRTDPSISQTLRSLSTFWVFLLGAQITLGAWVIWSNKAADIATAHVAMGAIALATGVAISAFSLRIRKAIVQPEAARSLLETAAA